jgi:hypothetical protein
MQPPIDLQDWLDIVTKAENLLKTRRRGFCYMNDSSVPGMLMSSVGIDVHDWMNRYFDYDAYN